MVAQHHECINSYVYMISKFHAICISQNFKNGEKRGQVSAFIDKDG